MKKLTMMSLITSFLITQNQLSADNAIWMTDKIKVYEKPVLDSSFKTLDNYKKYDSYNIISCNKYGWCLSKDGYVKRYVLKLNQDVPIVEEFSKIVENNISKTKEDIIVIDNNISKTIEESNISIIEDNNISKIIEESNISIIEDENKEKDIDINITKDEYIETFIDNNNSIDLTIESLIKEIVKRNPNMIFDRMQSDIIRNQINYEDAISTPQFYVNLNHQNSNTPNNTETTLSRGYLSSYSEVTNSAQMGVTGLLSTGAKWNTSIKSNDKKSSLIEKYKEYDTEYDNSFELSFTQPILKGFGKNVTYSKYYLAKAEKRIFDKQYQKKSMDMMGSIIEIYWKYYGAKEIEKSYEASISLNNQIIELLEQKFKSGEIAYTEVLEAKSMAISRKAELKKMKTEVNKIKNDILTLLNVSIYENKDIEFILKDNLEDNNDISSLSAQEYYEKAIFNWPEFLIAKEKLKKEQFNLKVTKNQIKPQLDFVASTSLTTLDDEKRYDYFNDEFLTWSVGLQFSIPLSSTQSKSVLDTARIKKRQIELEIDTLSKGLYNAISTKVSQLESSKKEVALYKDGLLIKEELFGYIKSSFFMGDKSIKDVLEQEADILNYKRRLFNTVIDWKLSQASLDKAVGVLFDKYLSIQELEKIKDIEYEVKLSRDSFGNI